MPSNYVQDCPRCPAQNSTFDIFAQNSRGIVQYDWVENFEIFGVCRACHKSTIFVIQNTNSNLSNNWRQDDKGILVFNGVINPSFKHLGHINLTDFDIDQPPDHTPDPIAEIFTEGSKCLSIQCWNAAAAMFRTSIDVATKSLLPAAKEDEDKNLKQARKYLFHRINWLIENKIIETEIKGLADCIREDGNDGVHDANLIEEDALDLKDFAVEMFERLYTTPQRLKLADERRKKRRTPAAEKAE